MRLTQLFTKTKKQAPADESARSAQLLIKGGFIYKEMAGAYDFLPLGRRVLNNIVQIVREEMDAIGGNELSMTALQSQELWEKTNRWSDEVVDNWFKTKLVNGTDVGLGFTHEEPITAMMKQYITSYKDLPAYPYQFQTKFRNEKRAKSGVMRGREFLMKDLYSFNRNKEEHDKFYEQIAEAYEKVYQRLGLGDITYKTFASGGSFSKYSHEFQTRLEVGEDLLFHVPGTDQYFNQEIAASRIPLPNEGGDPKPLEEKEGVGVISVEAVIKFFNITKQQSTKTLFYTTDKGELIAAAVRSDYGVNELKLIDAVGCEWLKLADEKLVEERTGAKLGYAGILNMPKDIPMYLDDSIEGMTNFETGANKTNFHAINVNFGRDVPLPKQFYDFKEAKEGDLHPETGQPYEVFKACEVGNIFTLGTRFSEPLQLLYADEDGTSKPAFMGSYGIGPSRLVGVVAEVFADDKGLVWPIKVAPAHVYLARLGNEEGVVKYADDLYDRLQKAGVQVLYDDRDERAGEKFADADLLGIPYRVVVSAKTLAGDKIECKARTSDETLLMGAAELVDKLTQEVIHA